MATGRLTWGDRSLAREHRRCLWQLGFVSKAAQAIIELRIEALEREMVCRGMPIRILPDEKKYRPSPY